MRLAAGLLFVALSGSMVFADDAKDAKPAETQPSPAPAKAPKVPLRVVRVLAETHQALLFDKTKGTHVLADVGKTVDGFTVEDIDDDTVTLTAENGTQIVLAAPDPSWRRHRATDDDEARPARPARKANAKDAAKADAAPVDPYAPAAAPMTGPEDPYGDAPMRTVEAPGAPTVAAPIEAGEGGVRTAEAPAKSAGAPTASPSPTATPTPTPTASPSPTAIPTPSPTPSPTAIPTPSPSPSPTAIPTPSPSPTATAAPDPNAAALAAALTGSPAPATPAADAPLVLARADVNAAIGNFAVLAGSIRGSFTPAGAKLDSIVAGSLFAKAGLRAGDTIVAVDNHPLRSIDDAADVYARSGTAKLVTMQILRAGKPLTLRVAIQ